MGIKKYDTTEQAWTEIQGVKTYDTTEQAWVEKDCVKAYDTTEQAWVEKWSAGYDITGYGKSDDVTWMGSALLVSDDTIKLAVVKQEDYDGSVYVSLQGDFTNPTISITATITGSGANGSDGPDDGYGVVLARGYKDGTNIGNKVVKSNTGTATLTDVTLTGTFDEIRVELCQYKGTSYVGNFYTTQALVTGFEVNGRKCTGSLSIGDTTLITI